MGKAPSKQDPYPEGLTAFGRSACFLHGPERKRYLRLGQDYLDYVRETKLGRSGGKFLEGYS